VIILAFWYVFTYREITFGKKSEFLSQWRDIPVFIASGVPLMVANLCSSLILTLDRQFVNLLFDTDTYAIYAFAYNMLSLITTAMSAIATVLYPKLRRTDEKTLHNSYAKLINAVLVLVYGGLLIYFPLGIFVNWFLPKYSESLIIFRIIFPGLAISSAITIVMHNYYKTLGLNFAFFIKSIIALVVSGFANFLVYHMFHTAAAISIASIITMLFWYVMIEIYFVRKYNVKWFKNFTYLVLLMILFYIITIIKNYYLGFIIYAMSYICITLLFNMKEIQLLRKKKY